MSLQPYRCKLGKSQFWRTKIFPSRSLSPPGSDTSYGLATRIHFSTAHRLLLSSLGVVQAFKRGTTKSHFTSVGKKRIMEKNKTACDGSGDSDQSLIADFWREVSQKVASKLSKSVVSIALSDGSNVLFACSGIAIEHQGNDTRFLTSANLATTLNDKTKDHENLKVEVRHEGNVVAGVLENCDLELGIAVVNVTAFLGVQVVLLNHLMEFMCYSKVVALGRDISGKLMFTSGMMAPDAIGYEDSEDLMLSTCKISEAWVGGPLFDTKENFVGINLFFAMERTLFLPTNIIFEHLLHFRMSLRRSKFLAQFENFKADRSDDDLARSSNKNNRTDDLTNICKMNAKTCNVVGKTTDSSISDILNKDPFSNLDSMGYPKLVTDVPRGSFIEWNGCATILTSATLVSQFVGDKKIAKNLRIEVLLPNKERRGGALQHYNLHYNVALVNVNDLTAPHPGNIQPQRSNHSSELLAIGRCFKSGILMAARGQHCQHTEMPDRLDCKLLKYSTCRITKAGIGGPLVDYDRKFIGMNFCGMDLYNMNLDDNRTWTPFLSSIVILDVLAYFKTKPTIAEVGLDDYTYCTIDWAIDGDDSSAFPNSWPVPEAKYYPREGCKPRKRARQPNRRILSIPMMKIFDGKE